MCNSIVKKSITESIDNILKKYGIDPDVKLFGNPVTEFDFENMSSDEFKSVRDLLLKKLDKYAV